MTKDKRADAIVATAGVDVVVLADTRRQASELVSFLESAPCETTEAEQWFSAQRSNIGALLKGLEDERKKITAPLNTAKRAIDALFAPATTPLKECEAVCLEKLRGAQQRRLEAETAARQLAATAAQAGDAVAVIAAAAAIPEKVATEGSSAGWRWVAKVVDKAAVPEEFKVVDTDRLEKGAAACKASGEEPVPLAGVEWVKEATIRRRA